MRNDCLNETVNDEYSRPPECKRAWIEVDLDALAHNAEQLSKLLFGSCELMAVVKADAYGHGYQQVSLRLQQEGIRSFAVATLVEGVKLREIGISGDILVLGYTQPKDASFLHDFSLSQLVIDEAYAKMLDDTGYSLKIHVAVDTGMHRLGIEASNFAEIEKLFNFENLSVIGTATHLASPDSLDESGSEFTDLQIERFFEVVKDLKDKGYDAGKLHAQSSYGIVNYPDAKYDYARAGILLYGVKGSYSDDIKTEPSLLPVLSLRAVIAQVRMVEAGESIGYGRSFTTATPMKLAIACIGYADGIPRHISGNGGMCLVNGQKVPIVGRVSMDLITIDVTAVEDVSTGDVVTIIGKDGNMEIRCEDVAAAAGTITNDILSRLGTRLTRIYR